MECIRVRSLLGFVGRLLYWSLGKDDELGTEAALFAVKIHGVAHNLFGMRPDELDGGVVLEVGVHHPFVLLGAEEMQEGVVHSSATSRAEG